MSRRFYLPSSSPSARASAAATATGAGKLFRAGDGLVLVLLVLLLRLYLGEYGWFRTPPPSRIPAATAPDTRPRPSAELLASSPTSAGETVSNQPDTGFRWPRAAAAGGAGSHPGAERLRREGADAAVTPALRAKGFDVRESRNARTSITRKAW